MYIQEEGGWAKKACNESEMDESTEEQYCSATRNINALLMVHCFPCFRYGLRYGLRRGRAPWLCLNTHIHA